MSFEELEPRPLGGAALTQLTREDLDPYSVEDLNARIEALDGEIKRVRAAMERKQARKSDADALFKFGS